jgi:hypothetical protein
LLDGGKAFHGWHAGLLEDKMHSEKIDYLGWLIPIAVVLIVIYGAIDAGNKYSLLVAASIVLIILNERRPAKIITTALVRIVDEKGGVHGLIGWNGEGVQIAVGATSLNNMAVAYQDLWHQKTSYVAFTFQPSIAIAGERNFECTPSMQIAGEMPVGWRSYSINFSYKKNTDAPYLSIHERRNDGTLVSPLSG